MAAQEIPVAGYHPKLASREELAEGTMAFHLERPAGFDFKAGPMDPRSFCGSTRRSSVTHATQTDAGNLEASFAEVDVVH